MATRRAIRDAFYDELVAAASGSHTVTYSDGSTDTVTVDAENIVLQNPEGEEVLPSVQYSENYTPLTFNGVGSGPDWIEYHNDGTVDAYVWREYIEAQFIIEVRASSEVEKEPIYEAVRQGFHKYNFHPWDETSLHDDIINIEARGATSTDVGAAEDRIRGDEIEVFIRFYRDYPFSTDNITQVEHTIEGEVSLTS